jgi:hypothetical protein
MKQRQLIKVVGTSITGMEGGRMETTTAKGIALLKRGQSLMDFAQEFLSARGITHYTLNQRGDGGWATSPMMFLNEEPRQVLTFHFLQFDLDDLGYHAKDLSAKELERDIKPLQKLIYKA